MKTKELVNLLNERAKKTGRSQYEILKDAIKKLPNDLGGCRQPKISKKTGFVAGCISLFCEVAVNRAKIKKVRVMEIEVEQ